MPTFIHHLAVDSKDYNLFRRVLDEYIQENPGIIKRHAVGFLGHNYLVFAIEDMAKVFRDAGIGCRVHRL